MARYAYRNLQFRTAPTWGAWSRVDEADLRRLEEYQAQGWEVYHTVEVKGSLGFTAHVLFMLRRELE